MLIIQKAETIEFAELPTIQQRGGKGKDMKGRILGCATDKGYWFATSEGKLGYDSHLAVSLIPKEYDKVFFVTHNGAGKTLDMTSKYIEGIQAVQLKSSEDKVMAACGYRLGDKIFILLSDGHGILLSSDEIIPTGLATQGVRAVTVGDGVYPVACCRCSGEFLFLVDDSGLGKMMPWTEFPSQHRGGKGVIATKHVGCAYCTGVDRVDEIVVWNDKGFCIHVAASDISEQGRNSHGSKIMRLGINEHVTGCAVSV